MIVTITPNPSLDRTYDLDGLVRGEVNRAVGDRLDPGGKGVNVARALTAAGHPTTAVLPLGGPAGRLLAELLHDQGIAVDAVEVGGDTRINVSMAERNGPLTKVNAPGPELTPAESAALLAAVRARAAGADVDWLACCGSLPRGLAPAWYAELVAEAHSGGARIALDTSGPALLAALPARPDVVKPNRAELAEAVGRPIGTLGDALTAARQLRRRGAPPGRARRGAGGMRLGADVGGWD
ncbi:1-phosphofructokinase family hexose kinase, partial [Kitasatospora sp. NPDC059571]|uniref:1-phosphofructokinase family hexose kinase n=1 Tax=Kitasatospora sp. NPDC059571 TaxID=3346871 RepID=UPI00367EC77E